MGGLRCRAAVTFAAPSTAMFCSVEQLSPPTSLHSRQKSASAAQQHCPPSRLKTLSPHRAYFCFHRRGTRDNLRTVALFHHRPRHG